MRIVDAHVHVWDIDAFPIPWFRDGLDLPRVASAAEYRSASGSTSAAIAVQVADSREEARWLMGVIATDPTVHRAVLQYEPDPRRTLGATAVAADGFSGIRVAAPQFAADLSDVAGLDALAAELGRQKRVLELLVRPEQLSAVADLAAAQSGTNMVLCHLGLGSAEPTRAWRAGLAAVAARTNTHAKFSGLLSPERTVTDLAALARESLTLFSTRRMMFGSDWPMSSRIDPHSRVLQIVRSAFAGADDPAFWAGTAERLYRGDQSSSVPAA